MARQNGIICLRGTVGGLVFARDGRVRRQPGSTKAAFDSAASMARVRENAAEFGYAAQWAATLRKVFHESLAGVNRARLASEMTQLVRRMLAKDTVNPRGQRQVPKTAARLLLGYRFGTPAQPFGGLLGKYILIGEEGRSTTGIYVDDPTLKLSRLVVPPGTTHCRFGSDAVELNLGTGELLHYGYRRQSLTTLDGPAGYSNGSFRPGDAPAIGSNTVAFFVMSVQFSQLVNHKLYPLGRPSVQILYAQ
jgi:hypothetical protein